jgi:hypothetical protein
MKINSKFATALLATLVAAWGPEFAAAQQPPAKPAADKNTSAKSAPEKKAPGQALMEKPHYDVYEPSQRLRTRKQVCMQDEVSNDAFCVKKCETGYQMEFSGKQAKCRSQKPLPPGVMPGPVRKQQGNQPKPPPLKPEQIKPGA